MQLDKAPDGLLALINGPWPWLDSPFAPTFSPALQGRRDGHGCRFSGRSRGGHEVAFQTGLDGVEGQALGSDEGQLQRPPGWIVRMQNDAAFGDGTVHALADVVTGTHLGRLGPAFPIQEVGRESVEAVALVRHPEPVGGRPGALQIQSDARMTKLLVPLQDGDLVL